MLFVLLFSLSLSCEIYCLISLKMKILWIKLCPILYVVKPFAILKGLRVLLFRVLIKYLVLQSILFPFGRWKWHSLNFKEETMSHVYFYDLPVYLFCCSGDAHFWLEPFWRRITGLIITKQKDMAGLKGMNFDHDFC